MKVCTQLSLHGLQATRHEEHTFEVEADLERLQSQLESREKELHLWKGRVRRLTEFSLASSVQGTNPRHFLSVYIDHLCLPAVSK